MTPATLADIIDLIFTIGIPVLIGLFIIYVIKGYRGR